MDPDSSGQLGGIIVTLVLSIFFSGLISAYEAALSHLSSIRLEKRADDGDQKSAYLLELIQSPHQTLVTLMISDWLADVTVLVLGSWLMFHYVDAWWSVPLAILILTPSLLIMGEIIPKTIATHFGERFVYAWLPLLKLLLMVFSLPVRSLSFITRPLLESVGSGLGQIVPDFTEDEILQMVNMSGNTGLLDKDETELVQHALTFDDTPASAVLSPRVDMVCVEDTASLKDALEIMAGVEGYSRLPVYRDNLDNIVGLVYIKDLVRIQQMQPERISEPVSAHLRKVHHIHEYQSIDVVLKEMQARRMSLFMVTDEYGGTVGLITMEDLLEEIVGEIHDEFDHDEEEPIQTIDNHTLLVDARVTVTEVNELLDLNLPNSQSIAGLVFSTLGEAPKADQILQIDQVQLHVVEMDGIRIMRVRIHKLTEAECKALDQELDTSPQSLS